MTNKLFIYGTLMRGEERDGLVAHLTAHPATVRGNLWRAPAGYPALQMNPNGLDIAGELLVLEQQSILMVLDLYEGVAEGLYTREVIDVSVKGQTESAWAYTMSSLQLRRAGCAPLKATDWRSISPKR